MTSGANNKLATTRGGALREILAMLSAHRDDETPVFDSILKHAAELCTSPVAALTLLDQSGTNLRIAAYRGARSDFLRADAPPWPLDSPIIVAKAVSEARVIRVTDLSDDAAYPGRHPVRVTAVEEEGIRSFVAVPLLHHGRAIGSLGLYRREVRDFTDEEVALVEAFAEQAVIAIENVRQFKELQTRLEREAASAEILQVISQSRDDEQPVFDAILERAMTLCDAVSARLHIRTEDGAHGRVRAMCGEPLTGFGIGHEYPFSDPGPVSQAFESARVISIDNIADDDLYRTGEPVRVKLVEEEGLHSYLIVPLVLDDQAIGVITLSRKELRPFAPDVIALVETFAAQAVIAIENVRQFKELQTRLEREAATRQVLEVISRSRDDEQPVFDAILRSAVELCDAHAGRLVLVNDARTRTTTVAECGPNSGTFFVGQQFDLAASYTPQTAIRQRQSLTVDDVREGTSYRDRDPLVVQMVEQDGARSLLAVPLLSNDVGIGAIALNRTQLQPFRPDEIMLIETFAAQAVIAIENVRQFRALEARTAEVQALNASLEARVEDQVGEIERMGKLKRFLPAAVADAVVTQGEEMLSSHRALIAVLFCDVRGFTAFCETAEPEETIELLQTYHQEMGRLIAEHGAGVDHRSGDGIMVIFNDPLPCDDPAGDALNLARAMHARMTEICASWRKLGHRLGFGAGLSLGYATVGMVGYEGRYDYTANGPAVNLAARLCEVAADGEILLAPRAFIALEDRVEAEPAGELILKGIAKPVEAMKVRA